MSYTAYPDNNTDLSVIWPDTLREVGMRDDMSATHESRWDELRILDWAQYVLLKQRNAIPHLQRIVVQVWDPYFDDLWKDDELLLQEKCGEEGIALNIVADDLGRGLWTRTT